MEKEQIIKLLKKAEKHEPENFFILTTRSYECSGSGGSFALPEPPEIIYGEADIIKYDEHHQTGDPECWESKYYIIPKTSQVIIKQKQWDNLSSPPEPSLTTFYIFLATKGWITIYG